MQENTGRRRTQNAGECSGTQNAGERRTRLNAGFLNAAERRTQVNAAVFNCVRVQAVFSHPSPGPGTRQWAGLDFRGGLRAFPSNRADHSLALPGGMVGGSLGGSCWNRRGVSGIPTGSDVTGG